MRDFFSSLWDLVLGAWGDFTVVGKCTIAIPVIIGLVTLALVLYPALLVLSWPRNGGLLRWGDRACSFVSSIFVKRERF